MYTQDTYLAPDCRDSKLLFYSVFSLMISCRHIVSLRSLLNTTPAMHTAARPKPQVFPLNVTASYSYIHVLYSFVLT